MSTINAVIEMPKGDVRRRHKAYDGSGIIDLGPIVDVIPYNNGVIPCSYGYIENTINPQEKDEIDVVVVSDTVFVAGDIVPILPIALLIREDQDNKVIAVEVSNSAVGSWEHVSAIEKERIIGFFGFKNKITEIKSREDALEYIRNNSLN